MNSEYFIGIDGGGSKTAAIVVDSQGTRHGSGVAGGSNHLRIGIVEATRNVERAVNIALVEAGIPIRDVRHAYCGIAGADHPTHRAEVVNALSVFFPNGNFTVDSDARIALTAAIGFGSGIVVIAGTGSVAFGRNDAAVEARAGGWGPTLGDEGSGYWIARKGLSAIVRAYDGRGPATKMTDLLCDDFEMCRPEDLPRFVYASSTHADDIARYGRLVVEAAGLNDPVALAILDTAGRELGSCVLAVARRLRLTDSDFPVGYVGGAFHAKELLLDPMRAEIARLAPHARVVTPERSPAEGAALMAMRAAVSPREGRAAGS